MSVWNRVRAASESDMSAGSIRAVCNNAERRDGSGGCVVRGAVEPVGMWILPERDDGDLSRVHDGDGNSAAEGRKDSDDGSDADVRHERRRSSGSDDRVGERNTGELQPGERDVGAVGEQTGDGIPGCVLRRPSDGDNNDDVHGCG